ncbi:hypothetical protein Tco_0655014 [Tanacetum coccineum]|uniref:Uncharacterized protein n=1 Tax=Tanacetum coccineum TaxID=301880 RepID=A0ABQ4X5F7_9ASTR
MLPPLSPSSPNNYHPPQLTHRHKHQPSCCRHPKGAHGILAAPSTASTATTSSPHPLASAPPQQYQKGASVWYAPPRVVLISAATREGVFSCDSPQGLRLVVNSRTRSHPNVTIPLQTDFGGVTDWYQSTGCRELGERCVRAWWSRLRGRENDVWMVGMITGADVGRKKGGRCGIREWWVCWGDGEWGGVGDRMMVGALKKGGVSEAERVGVVIGLESGRGLETTFIMGGGGRGWVSVGKKIGQVEGFVRGGVGGWSVGVISGKRGVLWSVNSKIYSGRALGTEDVGVKQGMEVLGYDKCHGRMVGYTIQHCFAMAVRLPVGLLMVLFVAVKVAYHCRRVCSSLCSIVRREGRGGVGCGYL